MSKVTFKCKRSGNTVSFILPGDIEGMRKHEGYDEVKEIQNDAFQKTSSTNEAPRQKASKKVLSLPKQQIEVPSYLQE